MAGLPEGALMQRAARGLAAAVLDLLGRATAGGCVLLVGSGDNGGDALYAGALLARRGCRVSAWSLTEKPHEGGLAALLRAGGRVDHPGSGDRARPGGRRHRRHRRSPGAARRRGGRADALDGVPVVAVDVPSGVDVDTGELAGPAVRADVTVTFGTHKVALLADPAAAYAGVVHLVDIGLETPPAADVEASQAADVAALLSRPDPDAQKYTRGVVGVRAGSAAYPGAGVLCVAGRGVRAVRDGAVRRRRARRGGRRPPRRGDRERPRAGVDGRLRRRGGRGDNAGRGAGPTACRLVVDADALALVDGAAGRPRRAHPPRRRAGPDDRRRPRGDRGRAAAPRPRGGRDGTTPSCCSRAGAPSSPGPTARARVTTTGVPWLATAGAGDVLAGLIGALLAAGLEPFDAASVGLVAARRRGDVRLAGRAADRAATWRGRSPRSCATCSETIRMRHAPGDRGRPGRDPAQRPDPGRPRRRPPR